jgi:hypothetical protein
VTQFEIHLIERKLAGFDFRKVEDIVDDAQHLRSAFVSESDVATLGFIQGAALL